MDLPNLPLPDFVIAGAPGAGTTFAHESLRQHPGICMPIRKELHHFCPDLDSGSDADGGFFTRTEAEYRSFFSPARPDQRTGEASPWYLYSREAPLLLRAADERIRVIVMLRDPVEIVRYVHSRRVQNGNEDLERLEDALDAEAARRRGERIPAGAWNLPGLQYREHGRYATHLAGTWPPSLASSCCSSSSTISLRTPGRCISGWSGTSVPRAIWSRMISLPPIGVRKCAVGRSSGSSGHGPSPGPCADLHRSVFGNARASLRDG